MSWEEHVVKGYIVEYDDETHSYVVDGIDVPSVTQLMRRRFGGMYNGIPCSVLNEAARKGTLLHETIEAAEKAEDISTFSPPAEVEDEYRSYLFLKRQYEFTCIGNEILLLIPYEGEIIAAGRMDMLLLDREGKTGIADIKRTSKLDEAYLSYQLTIYGMGLEYCYNIKPEFYRCIWLRETKRKYKAIKPCHDLAMELLKEVYDESQREDRADRADDGQVAGRAEPS